MSRGRCLRTMGRRRLLRFRQRMGDALPQPAEPQDALAQPREQTGQTRDSKWSPGDVQRCIDVSYTPIIIYYTPWLPPTLRTPAGLKPCQTQRRGKIWQVPRRRTTDPSGAPCVIELLALCA